MPNIEQLCLVRGIPAAFMTESGPQMVSPWAGLKVLVALGIGIGNWMQMLSLIHLVCTSRGDSFRHLEITCPHIHVDTRGTTWLDPHHSSSAIPDTILPFNGGIPSNTFKNMECFRVRNLVLDTEGCRRLMRESLAGRKLHSFDIVFDQPPLSESPEGITCKMRLEEFAWLRGTTAIRSIGVFNFRFKKYPRGEEDLPLPAYLASFPNLEILDINSEHYDDAEFSSVITEIIKVTKLKKIYQATVKGTNLDKLRLVAKKANVELIWGERPFVWPVPILNP